MCPAPIVRRVPAALAALSFVLGAGPCVPGATPFPADLPPQSLEAQLATACPDPGFEPSGAVWQPAYQVWVVVSDDGQLARLDANGDVLDCVALAGGPDLEAVCLVAEDGPLLYVGVEHEDAVFVYDPTDPCDGPGDCPTFDLTAILHSADDGKGLEALTFVPVAGHPEGGLFFAGLQEDGRIYVIDVPLSSGGSAPATLLDVLAPVPSTADISGLHYDRGSDLLYAVYDSDDLLVVLRPDGTVTGVYDLPGNAQEGVAASGCDLLVVDDVDGTINRYTGFPAASPDGDGDGVSDCADDCPGTAAGSVVGADGCACEQVLPSGPCCGDDWCDPAEVPCSCAPDCGPPTGVEPPGPACWNGLDDDCDHLTDCDDPDCCGDPACGVDDDDDGHTACDCDDTDPDAWTRPGEVDLAWDDRETLSWEPPAEPGGLAVVYDVLRADGPTGFSLAACVESDDGRDTEASDTPALPASSAHYYLVRAENGCPTSGSLGTDSAGRARFGRRCP